MGYNIELSQAGKVIHATDLCTNGGYSALCDWIGELPAGDFARLKALAAEGTFEGTDTLADEIERAILDHPPDDADVLHVANRLADLIGGGEPGETISIVP